MNRLRELRKARGLTSIQLGEIIGLSDSTVRFIERGDRGFSMESLERACSYFGVSVDYLLGKSPEEMLNAFVASVNRDFMNAQIHADGMVTQSLIESVRGPIRTKLEAITIISGLNSQAALDAVYACAKREQVKEDFSED